MDDEAGPVGSPITLAELRLLGRFVRWQDVGRLVDELAAAKRLPQGYPLVPSRLPSNGTVDLLLGGRWRQVKFIRLEGTPLGGNQRVVYFDEGAEKTARYGWFGIAPAGHYTEWNEPNPGKLDGAELTDRFELAQQDHRIHSQALVEEDWPYLTFEAASYHPKARWVDREDMWTGRYTVHAADPRAKVNGVAAREPWFNTTIAVSHRWLRPDHPDPDGAQLRELLALCEGLGLHDTQTFLIDYCSLPQQTRGPNEETFFRDHLPGFQARFKHVTIVLNTGSADYATRAWCMFELMLASLSRAARPTLLNHDRLEGALRAAREEAERYVKHSVWNEQQMLQAFASGVTNASFKRWTGDLTNVGLYNASRQGRQEILDKFEKELAVTEPNDRPLILGLLKRLAFNEAGG